ncbi:MAG: type II/IV secretion system protein [Candidatus Omnitrophica bacterium]|nr:type II/IV secretion system protein [Candidatus Omnitrophota bacterium]
MNPQQPDTLLARLKELGIATPQQIEQAKQEQAKTQERFGSVLVKLGMIRDAESGKRLAPQLGWMPAKLEASQVEVVAHPRLPMDLCRAHRIVPIQGPANDHVLVATDDPFTLFALEWLAQRCGATLDAVLVREQDLDALLLRLDRQAPTAVGTPASGIVTPPGETVTATDEPIIRLVDSILTEAVRMRASDVHIEPSADRLKVRYRIDGVLRDASSPPKALHGPVTSRIKIMAGLNIAEKRLPQDGRLQLEVEGSPLDVRVSILPALHGEAIVMRLLRRGQSLLTLKDLGMSQRDEPLWQELVARPYGMVLVTGPTGSGKTTTLYTTLAALNRPERKLITVEDPVEYQLAGVNQVHVKAAIGLTFAAGLRAMLRQAPDIIMVGEIRDQETAQIAIQAALTGHLIFSTLHTNDAPSAVTRLIDMGVAAFLVASTVQGVLAQRLVRRVCPSCRHMRAATKDEHAFLGEPAVKELAVGRGCEQCHGTGFYGRIGIYELLVLSDALRQLIVTSSQASKLKQQAVREGMRTLREDGRLKVREGSTTVAEVLRATAEEWG